MTDRERILAVVLDYEVRAEDEGTRVLRVLEDTRPDLPAYAGACARLA